MIRSRRPPRRRSTLGEARGRRAAGRCRHRRSQVPGAAATRSSEGFAEAVDIRRRRTAAEAGPRGGGDAPRRPAPAATDAAGVRSLDGGGGRLSGRSLQSLGPSGSESSTCRRSSRASTCSTSSRLRWEASCPARWTTGSRPFASRPRSLPRGPWSSTTMGRSMAAPSTCSWTLRPRNPQRRPHPGSPPGRTRADGRPTARARRTGSSRSGPGCHLR
mmetsp:Transcript_4519/g.13408  ORF Transcript_4519/g.13408 Transcript_4519/m.13408 type:complete len:217 (+) Transcript_4519:191-841(+)